MTNCNERDGRFLGRVHVEQLIDRTVGEAHDHARRDALAAGDRQQVRQHRAAVPEGVAIRTRLVLPGIAPPGAGQYYVERRVGDAWLGASRIDQVLPEVAAPKQSQAVVMGAVVIDARRQVIEPATHQVQLDVEQRARARRGAKGHATQDTRHAVAEVQESSDCFEIELS